jgi:colicin import membrane protein
MKAVRLLAVCAAVLPALAGAQDKVDINKITKVEVKNGDIVITGSRKITFSSFGMTEPERLVIDISEAVFAGVPEEIQIGNGTITAIKTATYGSDQASIARVLVGFEKHLDPDFDNSTPNVLIVKTGGAAAAPSPALAKAEKEAAAKAEAEKKAQEKEAAAKAEADKKAEKEAAAKAEAEKQAQAKAEKEAAAKSEAERKAQEKAEKEAAAKAEAEKKAQEKAEADARARAEREAKMTDAQKAAE